MHLFSPAKINLYLDILHKRTDGFHELVTLMHALNFGDDLELTFNDSGKIILKSDHPSLPLDSTNLIWKAIDLYYRLSGVPFKGIEVFIDKKIPIAAGLGGGSSNAVTVLRALDQHHGNIMGIEKLEVLASLLGSDTVFFLDPGTWVCGGRGEKRIKKFKSQEWHFVLIFPPFGCSTPKVYSQYILNLTNRPPENSLQTLESTLATGKVKELGALVYNSLQDAAFKSYPELWTLALEMEQKTREKVFLSGSGSTLFMVFDRREKALTMKERLESDFEKNAYAVAQTWMVQ